MSNGIDLERINWGNYIFDSVKEDYEINMEGSGVEEEGC